MRSAILAILLIALAVAAAPVPPPSPPPYSGPPPGLPWHPPRDAVGSRAPNPGDPETQKRLNPRPPSYVPPVAVLPPSEDAERGLKARFIALGPGIVAPPPKTDDDGVGHVKRDWHPGQLRRDPSSGPPVNAGPSSAAWPPPPPPGKRDAGGEVEAWSIGLGPGIVEPPPDDKA